MMKIINPATEAEIASISSDDKSTISSKVDLLRNGQEEWKKIPVHDRIQTLKKFGDLVLSRQEELAMLLTSEMGKPLQQSLNEINGAYNRIEHLLSNGEKWLEEETAFQSEDMIEKITYEPLGVIANISAWNYPYNVGYNVFLYALAAGNSVLYKPSEYASLTGLQFQKLLHESGIPEDVFQCVIGDGKVGQIVLEAGLDGYYFTGSYTTGQHIAKTIASNLVPVQLELGGKDPLYVMDDVPDVRMAAINAAEGAFYNNGQSCCAIERIYVHEKIYPEFRDAFVDEVKSYVIGDPKSLDTFVGPLTRHEQISFLEGQISDATTKGASIACGGKPLNKTGYYFEPTVLIDVNHQMKLMKEESFGPVIGIHRVSSDQEAIKLMLDTDYGLTSAVFGTSEKRVMNILRQMDSGTVYWNCCDRVSPNVPWSGRRNSGLGSTLSSQGIRAFVQPKSFQMRK